jgi:hypothetical protein
MVEMEIIKKITASFLPRHIKPLYLKEVKEFHFLNEKIQNWRKKNPPKIDFGGSLKLIHSAEYLRPF